ncbi:MAG TPA: DUF4004 family protein [Treponemataceae bacterium]|nr:DUF4004 family protein [Treponemataceae bacterium]
MALMDLISKKELLAQTGISYGQLYRWKREGLLPEEWFIKQASFTGQETFFPKDQVLSRIRTIIEMKDDYSLEELSRILVTNTESPISVKILESLPEIEEEFTTLFSKILNKNQFSMREISVSYAIYQKGKELKIPLEKISSLILTSLPAIGDRPLHDTVCTIFSCEGKYHICFSTGTLYPAFDKGIEILGTVAIGVTMNMLRLKLKAENTTNKPNTMEKK